MSVQAVAVAEPRAICFATDGLVVGVEFGVTLVDNVLCNACMLLDTHTGVCQG
jgi:hypothetical protein